MLFFNRNFVLLWQGQLVSQLGNQAFLIATALFMLDATGSALLVASALMASTVPLVIVGPIGGTVADRHSRRNLLVATDLARALAVGGLGLFLFWRPDATAAHVTAILVVAAFGGVMGALFSPAVQALIPELVPPERLAAANSVNQMSIQASVLTGQALGGVLYVAWGAPALLLIDAASFLYAAGATWLIPPDRGRLASHTGMGGALAQYVAQTKEGIRFVWDQPGMAAVLGLFAGVNFLFMPVFVLLPFYVRDLLDAGPEWYGFLLSGSGAGALAGAAAAGLALTRVSSRARLVQACAAGIGALVVLLSATRVPWMALAVLSAIGGLAALINVGILTTFQRALPSGLRGRVMGLVVALSTAAAPIGMAVGGIMGDAWRDSLALVFAGCGMAILLLVALSARTRHFGALFDGREEHRAASAAGPP